MSNQIQISQDDLKVHLREQVVFLETSAAAFDAGLEGEAKRIAGVIRTLVHDTNGRTKSLLGQLGKKAIQYLDTAHDIVPGNYVSSHALVCISIGNGPIQYKAMLGGRASKYVDFVTWWDRPIFKDSYGCEMTRGKLILTMAEQDGGVHVDPSINSTYAGIAKNNTLGWTANDGAGEYVLKGAERASMRQIAYEFLETIKFNRV